MLEIKSFSTERKTQMKKRRVILNAILLTLFAGVLTFQNAQDVPSGAEKSERLRHQFAMSLLRTINTAEVVEQTTYGSYSAWQTLVAHHSDYFDQFLATHRQQLSDARFADAPEILPGWNLRMNMHPDGQGYDILLRDMTDQKCGYAAITDENLVIRQSKVFTCEM
jgi:hypothetical protein